MRPTTKKEVRSFLGLTGYYKAFVPNYASIACPLFDLLKKGCPRKVKWEGSHQKAFEVLKIMLTTSPVLRLPDASKGFVIQTDASQEAVGSCLLQEYEAVSYTHLTLPTSDLV